MNISACPLCEELSCDCRQKLPKSYWKARALHAEKLAENEDVLEAKGQLIELYKLFAPANVKEVPSIKMRAESIANYIYAFVKDAEDALMQNEYNVGIMDVCKWLRENPPINQFDLKTIADEIEEHFGIRGSEK